MTYGATLVALQVPDRDGAIGDVVLGYDEFARYQTESPFLRVHHRARGQPDRRGRFVLDGRNTRWRQLTDPTTCTGGIRGFDRWSGVAGRSASRTAGSGVHARQPDGDEGYPGTLTWR